MSFIIGFVVAVFAAWIACRAYKILEERNAFDFDDSEELLEDENDAV
jgi:hypothetical protein